jgi:autotransporter-associated beta strand protein
MAFATGIALLASGVTANAADLYRNALSATGNTLTNISGWSTSATASGVAPASVGSGDTLTFSNYWTPGKLSTALWLDAADSSTLTLSSGTVTQWRDKSGNGRNTTQVSGINRPTLTTEAGMPSVQFASQALNIPGAAAPGQNGAIVGVFNISTTSYSLAGFINISSPGDSPEIRLGLSYVPGTSGDAAYWNGGYVGGFNPGTNGLYGTRGVHGLAFTTDSGTTTVQRLNNGTSVASGSRATGTWNPIGEFSLGRASWTNHYRDGNAQELITVQSALSTTDRQLLDGYLAWKWGLQASLAANNPYKNAAPVSASETYYLAGDQSVGGLVFSAAGSETTLRGGTSPTLANNTLTLNSGGITVNAGVGATTLGDASAGQVALAIGADQSWINNSAALLRVYNGIARATGDTTSRTLTVDGSGNAQLDGVIADGGASGRIGLTKTGLGMLILNSNNTYTGATTVSNGTLRLGNSSALGGSTYAGGAGSLSFGSLTSATFGGLSGSSNLALFNDSSAAVALSVGANNDSTTYSGTLSGIGSLAKIGAGKLTFSGSSSYTGATTVEQGSLLVNGQLNTSAVTVQSGGLLGGSGTLGVVDVLAGGTFSPGNSPGLISLSQLALAGTTLMEIDGLARGTEYDAVDVSGAITYGGSMVIDFGSSITSAFANNTTFNLFDFGSFSGRFSGITTANDGSWYGGLTFVSSGDNNKWTAGKGSQTLEFTHSTGALVIVPEPGALALAGIGIAAAWAYRSRSPSRKRAG